MAKKKTEAPRMLGLRTCNAKLQGFGGFRWPRKGWVEAPDWTPEPTVNGVCRGGLFFLPWGEGDVGRLSPEPDAVWMVVAVDSATVVHIGGKAKAPKAEVVFCGQRDEAVAYLLSNGGAGKAVVYARITGGDNSTLTGGYGSTLTGGYGSTLTGGYGSTLTGGYGSTLTGGDNSTLTGGDHSTLTGGYGSTLTGGYGSTLTGGYGSTLTGGDGSTLTGGDHSTLTGGDGSTLTGGDNSTLQFYRWDSMANRRRVVVAYVGEDGIEAGVAYRLNNSGKVVRADGKVE